MDDIDNLYPEPTREETRQLEQENALRTQRRQRNWAIAQDYAKTLRDPVKKAFAFEYAAYLFGTGAEKFRWNGKTLESWDQVWTQVPDRIRKPVYKAINAITAASS